MNFFLNNDFATWFIDLPSLVHRCGYLWNILGICWCGLHMLSNCVSPSLCCGDIAKCSPSLLIILLPSMFIVLKPTNSVVQFFAVDDPDWMSTWTVPCILILLLLKHLNYLVDFSGCFNFVVPFTSRLHAVSMLIKILGLLVSTSQYVCLLFV